ncbi:aminotransferase class III-fold pyridoxal phosphate-dependent enzyme [Solwaraspora sp. WMMA2101]|uniref:aminotransferase class III-fold pyridoxal phosphate-dependent enzyme n=1 Tax=Solwaraspora sp. WMMA2101 TaxID=3404124 RepID=UPI003B935A0A
MTGDRITAAELELLRRGQDLHLDHYQGGRLPYAVLSGAGNRARLALLDGPDAGRVHPVLDASGSYASACLGAGHEAIRAALDHGVRQAGQATDEIGSLERARLLQETLGPDGLWTDHFPYGEYHVSARNSGSEGMELALRLLLESRFDRHTLRPAQGRAQRDLIVGFQGAWHGWTSGLVPMLNRRHYRTGLPQLDTTGPYGVSVVHLPFGEPEALAEFFDANGHRILGVVVEPVQGDAGILVPPPGYLRDLSERCQRHGALLIADEVLTFAKTGRFFAMADELGPVPTDVTVIGKSIGMGAFSLSMVIARRSLTVRSSGAVATSDLRPLACAVVRGGLEVMAAEKLVTHAESLGQQLTALLRRELLDQFPALYQDVRGTGVMHGVELTERAAARLRELRAHVIQAGVYVEFMAGAGRRTNGLRYVFPTMRIAPPLITTALDVDEMIGRIADGSRAFLKSQP